MSPPPFDASSPRGPARVVRHALLRPARDDDTPGLRFAVEDALHTAEFNDCGRLVVVRRLRLGGLPPRAGPALVARALEEAWRAAVRQVVPAAHPSAALAGAVFFGSRFEARLAWLADAAERSAAPVAWFWRAALPELQPVVHADAAMQVQRVVETLLADAAPAILRALQAWPAPQLLALAALMNTHTADRLLAAAIQQEPAAARATSTTLAETRPAKALQADALPWRSALQAVAQRLGPAPLPPPAWVAALWWAPQATDPGVTRAQFAQLLQQVASPAAWRATLATLAQPDEAAAREPPDTGPRPGRAAWAGQHEASPRHAWAAAAHGGVREAAAAALRVESGLRTTPVHRTRRRIAPRPDPALPWLAGAAFTRHGGLLLLLNVLCALGFDDEPGSGLVDALLLRALAFTGAPDTEAQRHWFDTPAAAGVDPREPRRWLLRVRRSLRRHVRLDLPALVLRRAWVSATPTHIDVVYALEEAELCLRRAGLDSDPGWLPWFGRIVAFHFVARELLPEEAAQAPQELRDG